MPDLMADAIGSVNQTKPIFAYISPYAPELTNRFIQRGIAAFQSPEACAKGLSALWQISHWPDLMPDLTSQTFERVALGAQNYQGTLNESESKALFKKFHIPVAHEKVILTAEDAVDFYRYSEQKVVLKILSADILHKTEVGGVAVGVSISELSHSMALMKERVEKNTGKPITQFVIQEMETAELEMIVGVRKDILGMVLMVGAGGVRAEIDQDSAIYILPTEPFKTITREIILGMLESLKIWPLLQGFRGSTQLDIEALISVVQQVAILAAQFRDNLLEAEINPLFVRKQNEGVVAVDGVVILNP
jgi:acyl-CoA synthetase (NDP forming)